MSKKHTLQVFERDLQRLREEVIALAAQVGQELDQAVAALVSHDCAAAQRVVESDRSADALQTRINTHTTHVLARQQAMADDLRAILAAGRIAAHLERIGDYAKNTAKRCQRLSRPLGPDLASQFRWMGDRIIRMLAQVADAYKEDSAELANVTWADDAELDAVYARIFAQLLERMKSAAEPIADGVQLMFIAKGLERAGDHVTDIAEEIYLKVTGSPLQGPRPKVDEAASLPAGNP